MIPLKTAKTLATLKRNVKLEYLKIDDVSPDLEPELFYEFLKASNKKVKQK